MSIKSFIEESEREFEKKFPNGVGLLEDDEEGITSDRLERELKSFTSSKLRELIGEVKAEVEGMKKLVNNGEVLPFENSPEIYGNKRIEAYKNGFNLALDSLLQLLDEIK